MAIALNDEKITGLILSGMSNIVPEGFLLCDGSAISRSTYSALFALSPNITSTVTLTLASPCVVTWNNHGLATGHSIQFTTTGSLPTGLTVGTVYYIRVINTNTFHLYSSLNNAMNTSSTTGIINTSGTQSGTHTGLVYYWGNGNGSTTFNIPDGKGVVLRGEGTTSGYIQPATLILGEKTEDQFQGHRHGSLNSAPDSFSGGPYNYNMIYTSTTSPNVSSDNVNGTARFGNETRVKSIGVRYYIKY